jgi:predicted TPR repeat methyltransferase
MPSIATTATSLASSGHLIADRRYQYARSLMAEKDHAAALDLLEQTIDLVPGWAPLWFALGENYQQLQKNAQAIEAFERALSLEPKDQLGAGLRLAHLLGNPSDQAMPQAYVAALFDQYADRFDDHLTKSLNYKGPEILFAELQDYCLKNTREFHFRSAVDLGCGTGLMAAQMMQQVEHFIGVDLSEKMIAHAQNSGYYAETYCGDILEFFAQAPSGSFDLLIAADVLVYVGALNKIFNQAKRTLAPDGLFAFTVQSCEGDHFQLGQDLRYHHSATYLKRAAEASNLELIVIKPCVTRHDAGQPVQGFVVILKTSN